MQEQGFVGAVRLRLGPSRLLATTLIVGHLGTAVCLPLLKWGSILSGLALLAIGISLVSGLRREAWRCTVVAVTRVQVDGPRTVAFDTAQWAPDQGPPPAGKLRGAVSGDSSLEAGNRRARSPYRGCSRRNRRGFPSPAAGFITASVIMSGFLTVCR